MNMRGGFLSRFGNKTISWLTIFIYICSTFLLSIAQADAAQRNRDRQYGDAYSGNSYQGAPYRGGDDQFQGLNPAQGLNPGSYGSSSLNDNYSAPIMTRGYVLVSGDTLDNVAKRYNLSVEGLRRLNQDRFFKNGFDKVTVGDTVYVPLSPVSDDMAHYLETGSSQNSGISSLATRAVQFFADGSHSSELEDMAKGYFSGKANGEINRWFNQFGTSRIQLNVDDDFSLKNSQFEILLPVYDKGNRLGFTQTSIHRTDDRTQSNLGFGYRYFTQDYMLGGNAFWDYDISRSHSRMGVGVEYWRDYLKLGMNAYYRLSDWRTSPDVDDYYERPANGWDIRAEGYLPSYPKLGMKLNFEQYYGNEVGLFGKSERQKNPYAVTFGANYTPVPLLTFNLDRRQGASSKDDTRLGFQVNYRFGVPLSKQLDPDAVGDMRTLAGSRYDLVDRNDNMVLEYKKMEVIRLYMVGGITGFYNETYSLGISVQSRYDLDNVTVIAASLIAAGGKIVQGSGISDYSVVLPRYQQNGNNNYRVEAVAKDVKGNSSKTATTIVTVNPPKIDGAGSTFTPAETTLPADNVSNVVLTLSLKTTLGTPYDANVKDITLKVTGKKTARVDSSFKRVGEGIYEITVTAGEDVETLLLTPSVGGQNIASAKVIVVAKATAHVTNVAIVGNETSKVANGTNYFDFKATAQDDEGKAVADATIVWSQDKGDNVVLSVVDGQGSSRDSSLLTRTASEITSITDEQGVAIIRLMSTKKAVANIKVSAHVENNNKIVSANPVSFVAGDTPRDGEGNSTFEAQPALIPADDTATSTLIFTARDENGNIITGLGGKLRFSLTDKNGSIPQEEKVRLSTVQEIPAQSGIYVATLKGTLAGIYTIKPVFLNNVVGRLEAKVTLKAVLVDRNNSGLSVSPKTIKANNDETSTVTFTPKDANGDIITGLGYKLKFVVTDQDNREIDTNGRAVNLSGIEESPEGTYTATLKGTAAGVYKIKPVISDQPVDLIEGEITLKAGDADGGKSTFDADKKLITANDTDTSEITLTVVDQFNNPVSGLGNRLTFAITLNQGGDPDRTKYRLTSPEETAIGISGIYKAKLTGTLATVYDISPKIDGSALGNLKVTIKLVGGNINAGQSRFFADDDRIAADTTTTLTLVAKDQYGNAIDYDLQRLSFVVTDGNDSGLDISQPTKSSDGVYKATVRGKLAGQYKISPKVDNSPIDGLFVTMAVMAGDVVEKGKSGEERSTFTASRDSIAATNDETSILTFKARDVYDNPVIGLGNNLAFKIKDKNNVPVTTDKVSLTSIVESPDGTYTATLKGTVAGVYTLEPHVSGAAVGNLQTQVTLTAGAVFADNSEFSANPISIKADENALSTLTFKAKDAHQNPVTGLGNKLTFDIVDRAGNKPDQNKVILSKIEEAPAQSGIYVATLKGTLAGTYKITPKVSSAAVETLSATVTLTAGEIDTGEGNSTFQIDKTIIVADQSATLTLVAKDKFGNPIEDYTTSNLQFVRTSGDPSGVTITDIVRGSDAGTYTASVTGIVAGDYKFQPKIDGNIVASLSASLAVKASGPVDVDKNNNPRSTFEVSKNPIIADGVDETVLTFTAKDQYGNPVTGLRDSVSFQVSLKLGGTLENGKITVTPTEETANGVYKASLSGNLANVFVIVPKVDGNPVGALKQEVTLTAGKVDATSTFSAFPLSFKAGDSQGSKLTFIVKDANQNPVTGLANDLAFDIVDKDNNRPDETKVILSEIQESPAQSGIYVATLKGTAAGTYKIKPKVSSVAVGTLEAKVTINGGNVVTAKSDFSADPTSILADGSTESTLTFKAKDTYSNPVTGLGGAIVFTIKKGTVVVTNGSTVNLSEVQETEDGTYIAKLKGTASGVYSVTLNLSSDASVTLSTQVTLTAGEIDESKSSLTSSAPSVIADKTVILTLKAKDKFGNPIDYDLNTLKFVDKNGNDAGVTIGEISNTTVPGTYQATLTGVIAGDYEIVAKSGDTFLAAGSAPVKVIFGDPVEKGKNNEFRSTFSVDPAEIVADGTTTAKLTFVAKDIYGNAVTGIKDKLKFVVKASPTGASYTIGAIEVDGNSFSATFKGTALGVYTIVPQYNSRQVGSLSVSITVKSGDVDTSANTKSRLSADRQSIIANDVDTITLTFQAKDQYNNPVSGLGTRLTFDIAIQNAGAPNDGDVKFTEIQETTAGSGVYTAKLSGHVANSYVIKPKVDGNNVGNLNVVVSLKAGTIDPDHSTFTIDSSEIVADTNTILTLEAKDKFGNIVTGVANQLQLAGTPALATGTLVSTTEPQPGIYKFKILGITAGTYKIVPKQNNNELTGLSVDLTIKAGAPVAYIYIYPSYEARSKFSADQGTLPADGVTNAKLTFVAIDKYKNPVNDIGDDIEFYIKFVSDGGNAATASFGTKEANGNTYTNTFRATAAGRYSIYVKYKNADIMSVSVTVQPGAVAVLGENGEVRSTFAADSTSVTFDDSVNFTLTLKDKYGNVITGIPNNSLNLLLKGGTPEASATNPNNHYSETSTKGTYRMYLYPSYYPSKKPASYTIVPQRLGTPISGLSATIQVSLGKPYKTDSSGNQNSTLTATPQSRTVSDTEFTTLTFVAKDRYGNDLTGIANQLGLTGYFSGTFTKLTETETPGTYTATAQSTIVTSPTIYVTYNGNKITSLSNSNDFLTVNPSWTAGDPIDRGKKNEARSTFSTSRTELEADGIDSLTLTFTAVDIFGNTIYNDLTQKLEFAVTSGNKDDLSFGQIVRSVNVYTVTVKSKTVTGEYQIVPKFNGVQIGSLSVSLKVVPVKIYEYNTKIELDKQSYSFEQDMKVTVTLKNKNSYMVVGRTDWLNNGGFYGKGIVVDGGKIKDTDWTDNGNGTYTRIYTAWISGERKSYIAVGSTSFIYSPKYTIKHGPPIAENSSIKVGNGNTSFTANGEQLSVAVTIKDIAGNVIQDGLDEFRNLVTVPENLSVYSSSSWSTCYGGVSYCRTYMATKVGSDLSVTLKLPEWSDKISSQTFSIRAGTASFSKSIIETDKNEYRVGETITITVRLFDSFGNIAPNALSSFFVDVQNATTSYPKRPQSGPWGASYYPGVAMSAIINNGNGVFTAAFTAKTPANNVKAIFSEYIYYPREQNNIYNYKYSSPFSIVSN